MKKPYVFISYSSKEADSANLVHSYLEGNGIGCWIASRNIEGGESFASQIVDAINDCCAFVLMASPYSNNSDHVSNEVSLAFSAKKKIIPFRLQPFELSKAYQYFLQQAQWIDAFEDRNDALKKLLVAVRTTLPASETREKPTITIAPTPKVTKADDDDTPSLTRDEIVEVLLKKIEKFPYCLRDRTYGAAYNEFKKLAGVLFEKTVSMSYKGRLTAGGVDFIDIIVDTLSQGQGVSVHVKGLPGCAKNMLLQLAYYKMLENFRSGTSDYLPIYLSSSYYEKRPYSPQNARQEMKDIIAEESKEFFSFVRKNPEVRPVLMVEAVREHIVSGFAPEDVISELWSGFGKFNRIVALDVGLVKNRLRLKKTVPLMGEATGYTFQFNSLPISNKADCLTVIRTVLDMYIDKYDGIDEGDVYNALYRLRFPTLDIFTIRLVATELSLGHSVDDISLIDMYERLALNELKGDEEMMLTIAHELYEYAFNDRHNVKTKQYNAILWSLPHKHNTYFEFMVAYYFSHRLMLGDGDYSFLRISMSSMENHFMVSRLSDSYALQEAILSIAKNNYYTSFDMRQQSNAAYWLGKLTYADLTDEAQALLDSEFARLKPLVKNDNSQTLSNRYNQFLFRSVCCGLISHQRANILDEYLCIVVTNDVANAINRGTVMEYMGDSYQASAHNDFYLDTNPNLGEQAIRILCSRIESKLISKRSGFVEMDLVSLLTLVQARMHIAPEKLSFNLTPYAERCLNIIKEYHQRPRSIVSEKLLYYFQSVYDDLEVYLEKPRFDAAFTLFTHLSKMKETKRTQWLKLGVEDCESLSEHTLSAWMMAMVFLPQEIGEQGYNKQEIMDMLLVHDMAEAILGDMSEQLSEPTKELKRQNLVLRKWFLKGTYPEVANLTHYYNIWVGYFTAQNINSRIARDINLIQTVNTFFSYCTEHSRDVSAEVIKSWLNESNKLSTDIGYDLFDRIIRNNPIYRKFIDKSILGSMG